MRRLILIAAIAMTAGCTSSARFVERTPAGGTVAVPDYAHRSEALNLIRDEVGPNYAVTEEKEVIVGSDTKTVAVAGNGSIFTRVASWFTGSKQVAKSETKTEQEKEFRITYVIAPAQPSPPRQDRPPNP